MGRLLDLLQSHILLTVRGVRQLATLLLLLFISGAPAMACMLPGAQMTEQERACCRMMQGDCGHMQMPSGRACCQKVPQTSNTNAIQWKAPAFHPVVVAALYVATWEMSPSTLLLAGDVAHPDVSPPPESPPATNSILRV
jgi:hypothetical protein